MTNANDKADTLETLPAYAADPELVKVQDATLPAPGFKIPAPPVEVVRHVFDHMGAPPYRYIGHERCMFTVPGTDINRPGALCDHCATSIADCYFFVSKDGKRFKVGSSCVNKSEDKGMINTVKRAAAKVATARRHESEAEKIAALKLALVDEATRAKLASLPHPNNFTDRKTGAALTLLDYADFMWKASGNAGKMKLAKIVGKVLIKSALMQIGTGEVEIVD